MEINTQKLNELRVRYYIDMPEIDIPKFNGHFYTAERLLAFLFSERDMYPSALLHRELLRCVRKVEGISAKEANKRYGMLTAGEWRVKIRSVGNNEKE